MRQRGYAKHKPRERMRMPDGTLARKLTEREIQEFTAAVERAMQLMDRP